MNVRVISVSLLSALLAGCVGSGPNTQRGAVTGGALGALAGGIIGNNHGHQTWKGAGIGALAGALAGGALGNAADHENGTVYGEKQQAQVAQPAPAQQTTVIEQAPPPPPPPQTVVIQQAPPPGAIWVDGYWAWTPHGNVWVQGHWEVPPPGYAYYVPPHWEHRRGARIYVGGYWR